MAAAQFPNAKAQISRQATLVSKQAAKVRVKLLSQEILVGSNPQIEITALNAENEEIRVGQDLECEASIQYVSGKTSTQNISIKKGQSSVQLGFLAEETGFVSISVRPVKADIRADRIELIVHPAQKSRNRARPSNGVANSAAPRNLNQDSETRSGSSNSLLKTVSFRSFPDPLPLVPTPTPGKPSPLSSATPVLHLSIGDPNGVYRANGKDAAVISALFESPDYSPAPVDIHIWLKLSNGVLSPQQPLRIKRGEFQGTAQLTSLWPAEAHVTYISSSPAYAVQGDTDVTLHFVPVGAALVGPDKLSVVDSAQVMVVFYDARQNPVAPGKNWQVSLRSTHSKLHLTPASFEVGAASPSGSSVLFPVSWGSDTIQAVVANYTIQPLTIVVTGWMILALCLAGGVAGGLAAYNKLKGSWFWRIFLGILGGGILCWLYVYLALPNVEVNLAHNTFSVFFVALIGGYLGIAVLDFAAKHFGFLQ
jgi:hypothetical protein